MKSLSPTKSRASSAAFAVPSMVVCRTKCSGRRYPRKCSSIVSARYPVTMSASEYSASISRSSRRSRMGRPPAGSIGLGTSSVKFFMRVPRPAASITAFDIIFYNPVLTSSGASTYRWTILALLFFATTINYLDRIVLAVMLPVIRGELHLTDQDYGNITGAFQIAYTAGFLMAGKFIDRFGTRIGYSASILWWSVAAGLHALA